MRAIEKYVYLESPRTRQFSRIYDITIRRNSITLFSKSATLFRNNNNCVICNYCIWYKVYLTFVKRE